MAPLLIKIQSWVAPLLIKIQIWVAPLLIKIQSWLMQPHVWRFVGLASIVVGLSCHALSSCFNHLFGRWNLFKIFVYSVFSIIICLLIWFPEKWAYPRSLLFKAHMAFLVLTITSVYSFFFDQAVNRKPDAYSLVSCAAFAVTSLSLSRQIQCGFEVDLFYFFLGALIVQLMKIKLLSGVIGVVFSYSLINLRSSLDVPSANEHPTVQDRCHLVLQVERGSQPEAGQVDSDSQHGSQPEAGQVDSDSQHGSQQEAKQVDSDSQQTNTDVALIKSKLITYLKVIKTNNSKVIDMLYNYVKKHIKAEVDFNYKDHIPVDNNLVIDALQSDMINNLRETVELMLAAGFEKECRHLYSSCRRECLEECLSYLRQQLNIGDYFKMDTKSYLWQLLNIGDDLKRRTEKLEHNIQAWIKTSVVFLRLLFPSERRLCECIFLGFTSAADLAFTEVCREFTFRQLNFADSFAIGTTNFETLVVLPKIPKVFKALHDMIPMYESLFSEPSSDSIRNEAINTCKRLGKAIKTFKELEDWICYDEAMADSPGGLYPISCEVMDCLGGICDAWNTLGLEKVFEEHPMVVDREETFPSFSIQLARVIEQLDSHLEVKYENCTDPTLRYVFMMNNGRYIEQKATEYQSRMGTIFQDGTIKKLKAKVKQNLEDYQRSSWAKVIGLLKQGGNEPNAVESMKENLKLFNRQFKEICRVQSTWFVLDEQLRKEIREPIEKMLWPAYGIFIRKLQNILGSHADEYVEFSMYDIDALLKDLFRLEMAKETQPAWLPLSRQIRQLRQSWKQLRNQ